MAAIGLMVGGAGTSTSASPSVLTVTPAGVGVPGLSSASDIASVLLGPGVTLGSVTINGGDGTTDSALATFGTFTGGEDEIGIDQGLVIVANTTASAVAGGPNDLRGVFFSNALDFSNLVLADRADADLAALLIAERLGRQSGLGNCADSSPVVTTCTNNAISLELEIMNPTDRYLKFEYVLAVSEDGTNSPGVPPPGNWSGFVYNYPDGFALFVNGTSPGDNCAVVPYSDPPVYLTMQTAGIVDAAGSVTANRALARASLSAIQAAGTTSASPGLAYQGSVTTAGMGANFLTLPLTCVVDLGVGFASLSSVPIKIVIADANDQTYSPFVALRSGSIRFESTPAAVDPTSATTSTTIVATTSPPPPPPPAPAPTIPATQPTTVPATTVPPTSPAPTTTVPVVGVPTADNAPSGVTPVADPEDPSALPTLEPGVSEVLQDGVPTAVEVFVQDSTDLVLRGDGFQLSLAGECSFGCSIRTDDDGRQVLELEENGLARVEGEGFRPDSTVYAWLFSDPTYLGELTVGADGRFAGTVSLAGIDVGTHTLQVNGTSSDGGARTANLGVLVSAEGIPNPAPVLLPATGRSAATSTMIWSLLALGLGVMAARVRRRATS